MASLENEPCHTPSASDQSPFSSPPPPPSNVCMQKFRLYETRSNFYMIGRDKSRTYWKVLKIDRLDPSELNLREDSTTYTESECSDLLRRIHEGNKSTGGLKFVTTCYGIVGFIKFLGPYYMLLITKRRQIGAICGHTVYAVSKSEMIPLPNSSVRSNINFKNENRYLRRGVNEKGRVANDVETEQIVFEDVAEGLPIQISSIIQNRGSIPLFWSQETSKLNIKPDIILSKKDQSYQATRYHFENLVKRYGNPIIILNLIKTHEKKPRESILRQEFANAIDFINKDLSDENRLSKATNVLQLLGKVAAYALTLTGFFYCQTTPTLRPEECLKWPSTNNVDKGTFSPTRHVNDDNRVDNRDADENYSVKPPMLQRGVLRTNCIDCLDRTNVAQYAYGLAALGHQLHALGVIDHPKIDLDEPVADDLMGFYERMGDTLAHQYGGSAAHNKIFSERRGQWRAATQSQEFFRTLQRYYSNAYMDAMKQDAINVFLGHFQPQQGKPALWELGSDQLYDAGRHGDDDARSFFKRSFSDGNILNESSTPMSAPKAKHEKFPSQGGLPDRSEEGSKGLCESSPEISTTDSDISFSRYTPSMPRRQLFGDMQRERCLESEHIYYSDHGDSFSCSNFVDLDWLSSSGNSCEEEPFERSSITNSPIAGVSSENVINGMMVGEATASTSDWGASSLKGREQTESELSYDDARSNTPEEFPDTFVNWVTYGQTLCH
ncbi:hypothetical protein JHK87_046261 [Glycine soja]|nr:hypothetical protein JHK87_046261 [Glycine soja]